MSRYYGYNVHACPHCGCKTCEPAQMSGNTFGARYRSDMYVRAPMGFDSRIVARCPNCGKYHLASDGQWHDVETPPCPPIRKTADFQAIQDALAQLDADGKLDRETRGALRLRMLWASNDSRADANSREADANRTELLELVARNGYLRVELLRELGEFEAAARLIRSVPKSDGWLSALPQIFRAVAEQRKEAFWLARDCS